MTPRERIHAAFSQSQPDFTPCDYFYTPEIQDALLRHFGVRDENTLRQILGVDIIYVDLPYIGSELPAFNDGSNIDIWGVRRKPMPNEYGEYEEPVDSPYKAFDTVEDVENFAWPSSDWFDYDVIPHICTQYPDMAIGVGDFGTQDFINGIAFGRGVEQVLIDIAMEDPVYMRIVEIRHKFFMEQIERCLVAGKGRVDIVLCGDDLGSQKGLLISPGKFEKIFAQRKKDLFDLAHAYNARISHHCCGSSRDLIPRFIELGMDALQTIQPQAAGMDPFSLKKEFKGQITLHGGVDVQGWLQRESVGNIKQHINNLMDEIGMDGGFILAPCHCIQPDTPIENALAVYEAVAERKGRTLK